jgi:hypothetical protein
MIDQLPSAPETPRHSEAGLRELLALYNRDQRYLIEWPGVERQALPGLIRHVPRVDKGEGTILYHWLEEDAIEQAIYEQIEFFRGRGQDFEWKVFDYDRPHDLLQRLARHGFEIESPPDAIMVLEIAKAPERLHQPTPRAVTRLNDPPQAADVSIVLREVWGSDTDWLQGYLADSLAEWPDQQSVYVIYDEWQPISAGWIYFPTNSQFASLWGGSTLENYRRQGCYLSLLATRLKEAEARGVKYLTVDASPMSRPILERYGFVQIATATRTLWKASSNEY